MHDVCMKRKVVSHLEILAFRVGRERLAPKKRYH